MATTEEKLYFKKKLPLGFQFMLERLGKRIVRTNPENIFDFAAVYLEEKRVQRRAELSRLPEVSYLQKILKSHPKCPDTDHIEPAADGDVQGGDKVPDVIPEPTTEQANAVLHEKSMSVDTGVVQKDICSDVPKSVPLSNDAKDVQFEDKVHTEELECQSPSIPEHVMQDCASTVNRSKTPFEVNAAVQKSLDAARDSGADTPIPDEKPVHTVASTEQKAERTQQETVESSDAPHETEQVANIDEKDDSGDQACTETEEFAIQVETDVEIKSPDEKQKTEYELTGTTETNATSPESLMQETAEKDTAPEPESAIEPEHNVEQPTESNAPEDQQVELAASAEHATSPVEQKSQTEQEVSFEKASLNENTESEVPVESVAESECESAIPIEQASESEQSAQQEPESEAHIENIPEDSTDSNDPAAVEPAASIEQTAKTDSSEEQNVKPETNQPNKIEATVSEVVEHEHLAEQNAFVESSAESDASVEQTTEIETPATQDAEQESSAEPDVSAEQTTEIKTPATQDIEHKSLAELDAFVEQTSETEAAAAQNGKHSAEQDAPIEQTAESEIPAEHEHVFEAKAEQNIEPAEGDEATDQSNQPEEELKPDSSVEHTAETEVAAERASCCQASPALEDTNKDEANSEHIADGKPASEEKGESEVLTEQPAKAEDATVLDTSKTDDKLFKGNGPETADKDATSASIESDRMMN